jgi:hypothetical protein
MSSAELEPATPAMKQAQNLHHMATGVDCKTVGITLTNKLRLQYLKIYVYLFYDLRIKMKLQTTSLG